MLPLKSGCSVVRLNRLKGEPDIYDYDPTDWQFSTKYDIAVVSTPKISRTTHEITAIADRSFLTREEREEIGLGDDVFMPGCFVDDQGSNVPAVCFGNISTDPVPIKQVNGEIVDSYCIDMRSRPGFSGSPVFVYRGSTMSLLGIHWGRFPETAAKGGMTCVLPAWSILEVLDMPELKKERDIANARLKEALGNGPVAEAVTVEGDAVKEGDALLARMLNTPKVKS